MKSLNNTTVIGLLFFIFANTGCQKKEAEESAMNPDQPPPLFKLLSPQQTGIYFQNTLTEGPNTNILMYEYFFNGGGVAAGDVNGDGLIDLYFTSNMGENKMYINKGDLHFEDVTNVSGLAGRPGPWKSGVTMVDLNGDNKLDIHVSYSGALPEEKRTNQLFVNEGNDENNIPIFKEKAAEYGLDNPGYTNQAHFFDYDRDGDLDAILLNHNPKSLPILDEKGNREMMQTNDPLIGLRLFQQINGKFKDVTRQTGINGSTLSYGLGLAVSDLNNDGWPDVYICNDYSVPDFLYINNQDGTFTNRIHEYLRHTSLSSMGNDAADINNDGWIDIISLDMLPEGNYRQKLLMSSDSYEKYDLNVRSGFHHQYMRNMLHMNNGNNTYSEIGQLAGISNTDWSWSSLLMDYDNDGWKDLYITNGYFKDFTDMDFLNYMNSYVSRKGRLIREDVMEIVKEMPSSNVVNYMYSNKNGIHFSNVTIEWGLDQPAKSNGAAYADLDNDGDLDLILNNINQTAFIYENELKSRSESNYLQIKLEGEGLNTQGIGAKITIFTKDGTQTLEQTLTRGYLSSVSPILHFGIGNSQSIDSLKVRWPRGKVQLLTHINANQQITLKEQDASQNDTKQKEISPLFVETTSPVQYENPVVKGRDFDRQPLLISELSHSGPCMAKGDINSDGLEDILIGGSKGQSTTLYFQQKNNTFKRVSTPDFDKDRDSEDTDIALIDVNNDGHLDIYVASGGYHRFDSEDPLLQDRIYINNGSGQFHKSENALPVMLSGTGSVAVNDINGDGFQDLFVGGRPVPGKYPEISGSYLLMNDGSGQFTDQTESLAPELQSFGMITDAVWVDLNNDNSEELVVVGEWMAISVFSNENGKLVNSTKTYFEKEFTGWWNVIEVEDYNNDNRPDLFVGNTGLNTQFKVSFDEPAELYYKDFNNSGVIDLLFCFYIQGQSYPYVTRDELLSQLAVLGSRFKTYESFANANITDIFNENELQDAGHLEANFMETTLFLSSEDGKYQQAVLPIQTQYAPVYTITTFDYDKDGNSDVLLCGNNSHFKLRLGSIDANYGVLLKGNGKGGFSYIDQQKSGFKLIGDVRSVISINESLLFGINEQKLVSYTLSE